MSKTCSKCGAVLGDEMPGGLCPQCLMAMNLAGDTFGGGPDREPPTARELEAALPQFDGIEYVGRGGMGVVFKARQKELDRKVAVKILQPASGDSPAFAERFSREARALARLDHPGIVTIHDFGHAMLSDGREIYFLVMEFVDGLNLRQLSERGRIPAREALAIVPQVCDALQFAHDHGIVHRDIKPENILLDRRGRVKVADFGLARLIGEPEIEAPGNGPLLGEDLTEAGNLLGTPSYMAPEQTERSDEVDHRADIYALGVVLYELLTGERPGKELVAPSRKFAIDVRLDEIVLRALEKQPERRYQSAGEFRTMVEMVSGADAGDGNPRWSRLAIAGACWAVFPLVWALKAIMSAVVSQATLASSPLWWLLSIFGQPLLALTAPIGTTVLGWLAMVKIRGSKGRLRGQGLASFSVLLYPILLLDAAIGIFVTVAGSYLGIRDKTQFLLALICVAFAILVLDVCLVVIFWKVASGRWNWRRAIAGGWRKLPKGLRASGKGGRNRA